MSDTSSLQKLNPKARYLQIALNSSLEEAKDIIFQLPRSNRIILEAGTPLIKRYGAKGIRQIKKWHIRHLSSLSSQISPGYSEDSLIKALSTFLGLPSPSATETYFVSDKDKNELTPYIVADMKMMDRGTREVDIAADAGADAVTALGHAPTESLNAFIKRCKERKVDSMVDMMNVDFSVSVLRKLKEQPDVVILHRGVDETAGKENKPLPLHEIRRIKSNYGIFVAVAGGDTINEVESAVFNDADIVVVWKKFFHAKGDTAELAKKFLKEVRS